MFHRKQKLDKGNEGACGTSSSSSKIPVELQVKEEVVSESDENSDSSDLTDVKIKIELNGQTEVEEKDNRKNGNTTKKKTANWGVWEFGRTRADTEERFKRLEAEDDPERIRQDAEKIEKKRKQEAEKKHKNKEKYERFMESIKQHGRERKAMFQKFKAGQLTHLTEEERNQISEKWERHKELGKLRIQKTRDMLRNIAKGLVPDVDEETRQEIIAKIEKQKEHQRIKMREKRANMTEEEKEREREKNRTANLDEAKREEVRIKRYFSNQAWRSTLSAEQKQRIAQRDIENKKNKRYYQSMSEEKKRRMRERNRQWRHNLTGEKKERYKQSLKKSFAKYQNKIKHKLREEQPEKWNEKRKKANDSLRMRWAALTPDEKQRRLSQMKMYAAKRRLKTQLEGNGVPEEEIELRLKELDDRMRIELNIGEATGKRGRRKDEEHVVNLLPCDFFVSQPVTTSTSYSTSSLLGSKHDAFHDDYFDSSGSPIPSPPGSPCDQINDDDHYDDKKSNAFSVAAVSLPLPSMSSRIIAETPSASFSCNHCSSAVSFPSETDLRNHLRSEHLSSCWKCPKCMEVMLSSDEFARHFMEAHNNPSKPVSGVVQQQHSVSNFICMRCPWTNEIKGKMFETSRELHAHVKRSHSKYFWPCSHCPLLKYSKQSLEIHFTLCRGRTKDKVS